LEFWKRSEKTHAMRWGMTEFEENESDRPSFEGMKKRSPITGKIYKYFPKEKRGWCENNKMKKAPDLK